MARFLDYLKLARFHSPAGTLLLFWPTMWGLWGAAMGWPGWRWFLIFTGGVIAMRAFGCVINDIADRKIDPLVERTKNRPLAAGRIGVGEAAAVAAFFLAAAFALWLQLPGGAKLWALAGLAAACSYPLAKRITAAPQAVLGIAFGFGVPVAYAAVRESAPPAEAWFFAAANWFWVFGYDTIYAMCDRRDDVRAGIKSSAVLIADNAAAAAGFCYAAAVLLLAAAGVWFYPGAVAYHAALLGATALAFRFWRLCRGGRPDECFLAFRLNHWFGAFVWAGVASVFV